MEGQGNRQGWVGANAEHRLGCVCVGGLRNGGGLLLQSFHSSKASSTQLSRFALQRHKPAHNSSLSIDASFTLLSTLRLRAERSCCRLARQANAHCWD